ncbi:MAG: S8 family serine peptidase, partial [Gemmatimonadetes bacterium]|nr:S8 family serine peptidase [Gemmatimonadota bacterium]
MRRLLLVPLAAFSIASCGESRAPTSPSQTELALSGTTDVIVVLDRGFAPGERAANHARAAAVAHEFGVVPRHTYGTALFGFSATVPAARLGALRSDPRVASVELDEVHAIDIQDLPTGIDRTEADRAFPALGDDAVSLQVPFDVAILDTGIDPNHPDLNVAGGRNFDRGNKQRWSDNHGHGTHVAGTVGALDNDLGVVGVAPGVRLWGFRVCNNGGLCSTSARVAGMDWIASKKSDFKAGRSGGIDFVSANMSISFPGDAQPCSASSGALHQAACAMIDEGVALAMSAGNDGALKQAWPEPFVVSALADFDGKAGGAGASTCRFDFDDTLADFSNFGSTIDIAAPGVCILSTWPGGGYATLNGTSMASPHVAGAVALYLHATGFSPAIDGAGVGAIKTALIAAAKPQSDACGYTNEHAAQGSNEPLLFLNALVFGGDGSCTIDGSGPPPDGSPTVNITDPADGSTVYGIVSVEASAVDDGGVSQVEFFVNGISIGVDTNALNGYSAQWDTSSHTDGSLATVQAVATDGGGKTGDDTVVVTINNAAAEVHVGDLLGVRVRLGSKWRADVTITVHDQDHNPIDAALVTGSWSGGASGPDFCTTWSVGRCAVGSPS